MGVVWKKKKRKERRKAVPWYISEVGQALYNLKINKDSNLGVT